MFVSCSTRQRVGWRDYAERKVKTWLCPGLPRLCNTRAVCTVIMNQSKRPSSCGQLQGRSTMPDEVSRPHFVFFVAAGAAHLDVTRHLLHLSGDVAGLTQTTVPSRSWDSVRDAALFPAQSRNHVRLQHSEKVGVLVSMVLVLTLLLCSCFSRFTGKTLSRELKDVHVWVFA